MEIKAWVYFVFWANIGVVFIVCGFATFDTTTLPTSVSPAVLFLFKHFVAIATSHSITYTLIFSTQLKTHVVYCYALFSHVASQVAFGSFADIVNYFKLEVAVRVFAFLSMILWLDFWGSIPSLIRLNPYSTITVVLTVSLALVCSISSVLGLSVMANLWVSPPETYAAIDGKSDCLVFFVTVLPLIVFGYSTKDFSPMLVLFITFLTCVVHATISGDDQFQRWMRWMPAATVQENRVFSKLKKFMTSYRTAVELIIRMGAAMLFRHFFKLTSFDHVEVFFYFAVAWLANLAMLFCSHDLGVFNFLVTYVIMETTINEYGVGWTTWRTYGASVLLIVIRVMLHSLCVVRRDNGVAVISWRSKNETVETDLQEIKILVT